MIIRRKGLPVWLFILFALGCSGPNRTIPASDPGEKFSNRPDCLSSLTNNIAVKALEFFHQVSASGNWEDWGISREERTIKIWVLPPAVDFETSFDIYGRSDRDKVRLRLMRLIESSIGEQIEMYKPGNNFQFVDNSAESLKRVFGLINSRYSSNVFNDNDLREIGKFNEANVLVKINVIPGTRAGIDPILTANLLTVERNVKFNFSRPIELNLDRCSENIRSQFELLLLDTQKSKTTRKTRNDYPVEIFKTELSEFFRRNLGNQTGKSAFLDKFAPNIRFADVGNYLGTINSAILECMTQSGGVQVFSLENVLKRGNSSPDSVDRVYGEIKAASDIIVIPKILNKTPTGKGPRFNIAVTLSSSSGIIGHQSFTIDFPEQSVKICEPIGDPKSRKNKMKARFAAIERAALRVGFLLYSHSDINGDELKDFKRIQMHSYFNRAIVGEQDEGSDLCLYLDLEKITDLSNLISKKREQ